MSDATAKKIVIDKRINMALTLTALDLGLRYPFLLLLRTHGVNVALEHNVFGC